MVKQLWTERVCAEYGRMFFFSLNGVRYKNNYIDCSMEQTLKPIMS